MCRLGGRTGERRKRGKKKTRKKGRSMRTSRGRGEKSKRGKGNGREGSDQRKKGE